jgi:hypothetical protein
MRRYPIKALTGLILAGSLAGYASPAVFVATQAASGVSYLTTGKGTTDHVISAALEEDCALHRAIRGNAVCQPRAEDRQIQTASLGEWPPVADFPDGDQGADPAPVHLAMAATAAHPAPSVETAKAGVRASRVTGLGADMFFVPDAPGGRTGPIVRNKGTKADRPAPVRAVAEVPTVPSDIEASVAPAAGAAAPEPQAAGTRYYLVVGSFTSHANAQRAAQRGINGLQPARVIAAQLPRHTVYRVVVGPFDSARTDQTRRQLAAAGGATPWRLPVCNGPGIKGCIAAD